MYAITWRCDLVKVNKEDSKVDTKANDFALKRVVLCCKEKGDGTKSAEP